MEDRNIENSVSELIEDLRNKVEDLTNAPTSDNVEVAQKIENIKAKTIKAFNDASAKLSHMIETATDPDEAGRIIDSVSDRSKQLYEKACDKIADLAGEDKKEEITEEIQEEETTEEVITEEIREEVPETEEIEERTNDFFDNFEDRVGEATQELTDLIHSVGEELENFANSEEVKAAVDKTREGVIDVAEKALDILKSWLKPEEGDE